MSGYIFIKIDFGQIKIAHSQDKHHLPSSEIQFFTPQHESVFNLIKYALNKKHIKYSYYSENCLILSNLNEDHLHVIAIICNRISSIFEDENIYDCKDIEFELNQMLDDDDNMVVFKSSNSKIPFEYFEKCNEQIENIEL